ncbi:hypothetical protein ACFL1P_00930 [Patescibacteria group bacterium]
MASLTTVAYQTRKTINWSILAVIVYVILRLFWGGLIIMWLTLFPPKPPPPNHAFDKLPSLEFPERSDIPENITFTLETIEGSVPMASDSAYVYFMPKPAANLLAITTTQDFAKKMHFNPTPIRETKNIYNFFDNEFSLRKLQYDIVSNNFILRYNFENDIGIFREKQFKNPESAISETRALLQNRNIYVPDLANGYAKLMYLKLTGNKLFPTTSLTNADALKVDLFRGPVGDMEVMTPFPDDGQVSIIYSGSNNDKKRLVQLAYTFWPADYNVNATYSLKTSEQAWQDLQSGVGYIARAPSEGTEAIVRDVYLAYYDTFDPQMYMQPIYVFEGDHEFLGYVHAINPDWVGN